LTNNRQHLRAIAQIYPSHGYPNSKFLFRTSKLNYLEG